MPGPEVEKKTAQLVFDENLVSTRPKVPRELIDQETLAGLAEEKTPPWLSTDEAWKYLKGLDPEARWFIQNSTIFQVVKKLVAFPFDPDSPSTEVGVLSIMAEWREDLDYTLGEEAAQRVVRKLAGMTVGQRLRRDQGYHSAPGTKQYFGETKHETQFAWEHDFYYHPEVNAFIENLSELDWWFLTSLHPRLDFEVPWWSERFAEIGGRIDVRKRAFYHDKFDPKHETEERDRERKWWLFSCRRLGAREEMPPSIGWELYPEWLALPPWKQKWLLENPTFWRHHASIFGKDAVEALERFSRSGTRAMTDAIKSYQGSDEFKEAGRVTREWGKAVQRAMVYLENRSVQYTNEYDLLARALETLWGSEINELIRISNGPLISHSSRQRLFEAFLGPVQEAVEQSQEIPLDPVEPLPVENIVRLLFQVYGLHIDLRVNDDLEVERVTRALMIIARETLRPEYRYLELRPDLCPCIPEVRVGGGYRVDFVSLPSGWEDRDEIRDILRQTCPRDLDEKVSRPHLKDLFENGGDGSLRANKERIVLVELKAQFGSRASPHSLRHCLRPLFSGAAACQALGLDKQFDLNFRAIQLTAWQREITEMTFDELLELAPQPIELVEAVTPGEL